MVTSFYRNGLAEKAEQLIKRSQTSYLLWQKEVETHIASSRKVAPNLCVRVINIAHAMSVSNMSRDRGLLRNILAQCEILLSKTDGDSPFGSTGKCTVLFSFPTQSNRHFTESDFPEGVEVDIWRPFFEVNMDTGAFRNLNMGQDADGNTANTKVLLCSRFFVKAKT